MIYQIGKFLFPHLRSDQRRHRLRMIVGTVLAIALVGGFIVGMFFLLNKPNN
jgi:hypothetical protein